jgi:UDP-N-acetylglucosamine 3-dehydrogenase
VLVNQAVRVALIGLGRMGANHLRVINENPNFQLVAIVDPLAAQSKYAIPSGVARLTSLGELQPESFDAAIVACPTSQHFEVGKQLVTFKRPILMEKPLCATAWEARTLVEAAKASGTKLYVGHVERFNPAIIKLKEVLTSGAFGKAIHFSFTRIGGYPNDAQGSRNVLLDLAVHDLDILSDLAGIAHVRASMCHSSLTPGVYDTAEILVSCLDGASASIHVNWITPTKIRSLRITGTKGVCFVDLMLQTCTLYGGNLLGPRTLPAPGYQALVDSYKNSDRVEFGVPKEEPLKSQLQAFYGELQGLETRLCKGEAGAYVVECAEHAIRDSEKYQSVK